MTILNHPISLAVLTIVAIAFALPCGPELPTHHNLKRQRVLQPRDDIHNLDNQRREIIDVAVLVGSLREYSYSRMMAEELKDLSPDNMRLQIVEIGDMPFYNPDIDGRDAPRSWRIFRERIGQSDAVLFLTPEYNRSIPAVLKNAIDVGSRPHRAGPMARKPAAIISLTTGGLGGFGANHHLRQSLVVLDVFVMQQPEAYMARVDTLFDDQGNLTDDGTRRFLSQFMTSFEEWSTRILLQCGGI